MKVSSNTSNVVMAGVSSAVIGGFILMMVSTGCAFHIHLFVPLLCTGIALFGGGFLLGFSFRHLTEPEDPFDEKLLLNRVKQAMTKGIGDHQL